jgi:hypothetical protein
MQHEITRGDILIKDDAPLPQELRFESQPCVPNWKVVTSLKSPALDREIQKTGWTFLSLAGETKASVFGIDHAKMIRRAIEAIVTSKSSQRFNSLEIVEIKFVGSPRFPLVHYVALSAQWRHIQQHIIPFLSRDILNERVQESDIRGERQSPVTGLTLQHVIA